MISNSDYYGVSSDSVPQSPSKTTKVVSTWPARCLTNSLKYFVVLTFRLRVQSTCVEATNKNTLKSASGTSTTTDPHSTIPGNASKYPTSKTSEKSVSSRRNR